ncbi:MAG: DUF2807 domain-containing protein [Bacteroidales bacterium]|nr:DUF2807 domain-containing protein [Bacteroidales bacterium]
MSANIKKNSHQSFSKNSVFPLLILGEGKGEVKFLLVFRSPRHLIKIKIVFFFTLFFISTCFNSCKKENICDCFKNTGKIKTELRQISEFDKLEISDNIILTLIKDTFNSLKIEAGVNLLKLIKSENINGKLYLSNNNKCNWVRSYEKKIYATLTFKKLGQIIYRGSGGVKAADTIKVDNFTFECWDCSGKVELTLLCNNTFIKQHIGTADFFIMGSTYYNYIWSAGYGIIDCQNLRSNKATVINKGTNSTYVYAEDTLEAEIYYNADIYYKGNPFLVKSKIYGKGSIIKL